MSQPKETSPAVQALAQRIVEAYEADVVTGNAPGITLRDLIEVEVQELLDKTALAVGEAMCRGLLGAIKP